MEDYIQKQSATEDIETDEIEVVDKKDFVTQRTVSIWIEKNCRMKSVRCSAK